MKRKLPQDIIWSNLLIDAIERNIPIECGFELTSRCNFNCKMCYVHTQNSKEIADKELSTDEWKHIFDEAIHCGMQYALLTGGECLLRDDFKELYLYLLNKGVFVSVNSNASLISPEYIEFFSQHRPYNIQITLYGADNEIYSAVTSNPAYHKVQDAIDSLLKENIRISLVYTICRQNYRNLPQMIQFARNRELRYKVSSDLVPPRSEKKDDYSLSLDEYMEVQRILFTYNKKREPVSRPTSEVPQPGGNGTEFKPYVICKAGRASAFINWQGKMLPCASVIDISADLRTLGYEKAWKKINRTVLSASVPDKCNGCAYASKCIKCPAVRSGGILQRDCNENCCEAMKRKYSEGLIRKL